MTRRQPDGHATGQSLETAPRSGVAAAGDHGNRMRALWNGIVAAFGTVVGLAPHVLHHIGLIAGTALVTGALGTTVFGIIGLLASIPFLLRLNRRFGTWWAPALGLAAFAVMFSLSAFVIGPAIDDTGDQPPPSDPSANHTAHHP